METDAVDYQVEGDCVVIHLPKEVDNHSSRSIREDTERILAEYARRPIRNMVFDFSRTSFCDSSGIGVILGRYKRMRALGGTVYVSGESMRIERILRISGVYQVVERAEKVET
jgi:stage II sporulation protein AA (anti-sigma F factor antagonist)